MRASLAAFLSIFLMFFGLLIGGCDPSETEDPATPSQEATDEEDPSDLESEEVAIAYGGDVRVTLADVERAVDRMRLMARRDAEGNLPDGEATWMSSPNAQIALVRNIVHFEIVRLAASEREIPITPEEEREFLATHPDLAQYLALFLPDPSDDDAARAQALTEELSAFGLSKEDVRHLLHDMIYAEKLKDHLAEEFPDDQLRAIYQNARDQADLVILQLHNSPTTEEIDRAVERLDQQIRAHYRQNREHYTIPEVVRATLLAAPSDMARAEATDTLPRAAERLAAGEDPEAIAADLGLTARVNIRLRPQQSPEAYRAPQGQTGVSLETISGSNAWRVDERQEGGRRELDRGLFREIASELLRDEGITASNLEQARRLRALLTEDLRDRALEDAEIQSLVQRLREETDGQVIHTGPFSLRGSGVVPHIGLAETLLAAVKDLEFDQPVTEPILDRNRIFIARLVDRSRPDPDAYEEERDEFRQEFLTRNRDRLVEQYVTRYQMEENLSFEIGALGQRFGHLAKGQSLLPQESEFATPDESVAPPGNDDPTQP